MLLDGTKLNVMRPSWFAKNPAIEVAFHADPGYGRRHVDGVNCSPFEQKSSAVRVQYLTCAEESQVRNLLRP
jgi:hypothetical protein